MEYDAYTEFSKYFVSDRIIYKQDENAPKNNTDINDFLERRVTTQAQANTIFKKAITFEEIHVICSYILSKNWDIKLPNEMLGYNKNNPCYANFAKGTTKIQSILIVGAGPVGLMIAQ